MTWLSVEVNDQIMFQELNALYQYLALTDDGAGLWAVGILLLVTAWRLWSSRRLGNILWQACSSYTSYRPTDESRRNR